MSTIKIDQHHSSQTTTTNYCSTHPNEPITYFCGSENCHQRPICNICKDAHHSQKQLIPSDDLKDFKLLTLLEKAAQEEGPENPEAALQQAEIMLTDLKKELDDAFEELKKSTLEFIQSKMTRTKSWNTLYSELQRQYHAAFDQNFSPRGRNLEEFTKNYVSIAQQLENRQSGPQTHFKFPKSEFDKLAKEVKETLKKHQSRLVNVEVRQAQSKIKIDFQKITKKLLKTDYTGGIKPSAITYLEDLSIIATSGDKDITLWTGTDFTKIETKLNVHTEPIISLAYVPTQKTLLSCAWDRTVKIFGVTKEGFRALGQVLTLPHNNSVSALLPIEQKGVLIGGGQGPNLRMWGLRDFKLKGMIKTDTFGDFGPKMTYCKKDDVIAVFYYKLGKIGLISLGTRQHIMFLDITLKGNDLFTEAMLYMEKRNLLLASSEFGKLKTWSLQNKRAKVLKEIDVKGYCFGMVGTDDGDYVLAVNYMKELQVISAARNQVLHNITLGLKNAGSLIHMKNLNKFLSADGLSNKICVLNYN